MMSCMEVSRPPGVSMVIRTRLACSRAACSIPPSMYSAMIGSISSPMRNSMTRARGSAAAAPRLLRQARARRSSEYQRRPEAAAKRRARCGRADARTLDGQLGKSFATLAEALSARAFTKQRTATRLAAAFACHCSRIAAASWDGSHCPAALSGRIAAETCALRARRSRGARRFPAAAIGRAAVFTSGSAQHRGESRVGAHLAVAL